MWGITKHLNILVSFVKNKRSRNAKIEMEILLS